MPPLSVKDLTMPAAAFTMAIILTAHVYNSINHARLDAAIARDQKLTEIEEKRRKRYEESLRTIERKEQEKTFQNNPST
ncbi:hypothetical protein L486_08056 [Kwoniella mangroviensis CBS 10435]|uniref:Uncharacterized protein n=1 Tax=Kwoniella mangroviensis CBS 10435 TaxID=1331196 RepID=A0A1B9IGD1_9TREE|nr:uncharacterized protein I203_00990 [Kwoniella mangroviensis CBS 8507]OCF54507.1 hypothetical protein L486_08056 [Kwoniella mangroviensis CBS 10435]OCF69137.1 hypothetical protein I203_00990 [Kwoniella mangroviensis CBS 8507]OCF72654.1 hypothetical protein I204_07037 [Kwoniella mangroviensis CBS 8886]